ncbi:hypothetical protein LOCC1_G004151 [Lachnellula occidentalis]|uniref:Aminoglycoside phosphotransferase domain-containing protein n=1 Tax=Lachnellula occidentalis TaxID=215460 RepID=A0A8H8S3X4_9HELO|nr:hypothetical protein LOCC1_G004151 [Lachnellula occidentalis]
MAYIPPLDNTETQHEGTAHLAIHNTFLRRSLTLLALKTTARFFKYDGPCARISKNLIVKTSPSVHLTEATTMEFVAANTSIPVPHVYCSFVHRNRAYIVMERISGQPFPEALKTLSDADREDIFTQLRSMIQQLRKLEPPPGTGVESCTGGSLRDPRNPRARPRFGPFKKVQDFHLWLRDGVQIKEHPEVANVHMTDQDWRDLREMAAKQDGAWSNLTFTHGDLNPFNIMIRGNQVVSIIDWESAGWYPFYWEYTSAWCGNITRKWWQDRVIKFLDPYPDELKMEITRQKWWGEV